MIIYKAIYKLTGKCYVGQTVRSLQLRMYYHSKRNRTYFERAITKCGLEAFEFSIIDTATSIEELNAKEMYWIEKLNCLQPFGYNITKGGKGSIGYIASSNHIGNHKGFSGLKHSQETRQKMSNAAKGSKKPWTANRNRTVEARKASAKKPSEETKTKMSEARKAYWARKKAA